MTDIDYGVIISELQIPSRRVTTWGELFERKGGDINPDQRKEIGLVLWEFFEAHTLTDIRWIWAEKLMKVYPPEIMERSLLLKVILALMLKCQEKEMPKAVRFIEWYVLTKVGYERGAVSGYWLSGQGRRFEDVAVAYRFLFFLIIDLRKFFWYLQIETISSLLRIAHEAVKVHPGLYWASTGLHAYSFLVLAQFIGKHAHDSIYTDVEWFAVERVLRRAVAVHDPNYLVAAEKLLALHTEGSEEKRIRQRYEADSCSLAERIARIRTSVEILRVADAECKGLENNLSTMARELKKRKEFVGEITISLRFVAQGDGTMTLVAGLTSTDIRDSIDVSWKVSRLALGGAVFSESYSYQHSRVPMLVRDSGEKTGMAVGSIDPDRRISAFPPVSWRVFGVSCDVQIEFSLNGINSGKIRRILDATPGTEVVLIGSA
ncbi:MAG: hypothetical protein NUV53_03545 [Patescibacteria group bacterium]|nr:hypothetical protein [Patescibacteria group bacterium]